MKQRENMMNAYSDFEFRTFTLKIRCENCMREEIMGLGVPDVPGSPTNAEELREGSVLNSAPFQCRKCESIIGQIVDIGVGIVKL